jgi:hypothetical protein
MYDLEWQADAPIVKFIPRVYGAHYGETVKISLESCVLKLN